MQECSVYRDSSKPMRRRVAALPNQPEEPYFEDLASLLDFGGDGMVALDSRWRCIFINQNAERILGERVIPLPGNVLWEVFPHLARSEAWRYYHQALQERIPVEFTEFNTRTARWFEQRCLPTVNGGILVLLHDITESQRVTEEKQRQKRELQNALDLMPQITWISGTDGIVTYFNRRFYQYTGIGAQDTLTSINWLSLIHPDDLVTVERLREWVNADTEIGEYEFRLRRHDGEYRWHQYRAVLLPGDDGQGMQHVSTAIDIHTRKVADDERRKREEHLREANARLEVAASTDVLTGAANRRSLSRHLKMEWAYAIRYGLPLSVLLLDVDHFKSFNDEWGHSAGDEALLQTACLLTTGSRENDFIARFGGEEFVIVLPHTGEEEALTFAERIRTLIQDAPWSLRPLTVSIGVATMTLQMKGPDELLGRADTAMYLAKQTRNRVCHAREIDEVNAVL